MIPHRLLHDFARDFAIKHRSIPVAIRNVLLHRFLHHVSNICVYIGWLVRDTEVDLTGTLRVAAKGCIMLQAVTGTILMDGKVGHESCRVARLESSFQLLAGCQTLPGIISILPPATSLSPKTISNRPYDSHSLSTYVQWVVSTVVDVVKVIMNELDTFFEGSLVITVQVSTVDLQPPQTSLSERPRFTELQQPTTEVVADMVQVRGDRISTTAEIKIVRHVDGVTQELIEV